MSYLSHLSLPTLSPTQVAREESDLEDLFGDSEDDHNETTTADANASSGVACPANAIEPTTNTFGNNETRQINVDERFPITIPSSPQIEQGGPPATHNQLSQDYQTFNMSALGSMAGASTGLNYEFDPNGPETHNLYNFQNIINENTFPGGGSHQLNSTHVQMISAPRTNGLLDHEYMQEYYHPQNTSGALGGFNSLPQFSYAQQSKLYQAPQASGSMSNEYVQYNNDIALPPTQTQTPLSEDPELHTTHRTVTKGPKTLELKYNGALPIAPGSIALTFDSLVPLSEACLGAQVLPDGRLVYYDQFTDQSYCVPPAPMFQHRGLLSTLRGQLDHTDPSMNLGAPEMSHGDIHQLETPKVPPVIPTGQQPIPSTSTSNQVLPTRSKRPREDAADTLPQTNPAHSRKRRFQYSATTPVYTLSYEERRLIPPFVVLGPKQYVCNYVGPVVPNAHRIYGSMLMSGTRNRDRHLGGHAELEEGLVNKGIIQMDDAHALFWVKKIVFKCDIEGCGFSTAVWRTDNVRKKHIAQAHPELRSQKWNGQSRRK